MFQGYSRTRTISLLFFYPEILDWNKCILSPMACSMLSILFLFVGHGSRESAMGMKTCAGRESVGFVPPG
jgi:hypothetical protein